MSNEKSMGTLNQQIVYVLLKFNATQRIFPLIHSLCVCARIAQQTTAINKHIFI